MQPLACAGALMAEPKQPAPDAPVCAVKLPMTKPRRIGRGFFMYGVNQSSFSHSDRLSCMVVRISLSALRCCEFSPRGMGPMTLLFMLPDSK